MSPYPNSVAPHQSVEEARRERTSQMYRAIAIGILLRICIVGAELTAVMMFGSAALLMDALSSLVDVVSSVLLLLFIKFANRPPDETHPFGHGRMEPLAGFQLGFLLALVGGGMLIREIWHFQYHSSAEMIDNRLWILPLFALILLEICQYIASSTAKKHQSPAISADAAHYRIDSLTSLLAMISLGIGAFFPEASASIDHYGAIAIAIVMILLGVYSAKDNLHQLLDRTPPLRYFLSVKTAALNVAGVLGTEKIRIQHYGPDAHVDIDVEVDPKLSVEEAHLISQHVRAAIQKDWPMVRDVTVHIEPYYPGDH